MNKIQKSSHAFYVLWEKKLTLENFFNQKSKIFHFLAEKKTALNKGKSFINIFL